MKRNHKNFIKFEQLFHLRLAHRLIIAMTRSVETSCALPRRLLASLCNSDFNVLLARWLSFALMTVVCDTWGNASSLTLSSCTNFGILFFVATLIAVDMSVRFSQAKINIGNSEKQRPKLTRMTRVQTQLT